MIPTARMIDSLAAPTSSCRPMCQARRQTPAGMTWAQRRGVKLLGRWYDSCRNRSNLSVGDQSGRAIVFPFAPGQGEGGWVSVINLEIKCDTIR
jgi:hypothetical protein